MIRCIAILALVASCQGFIDGKAAESTLKILGKSNEAASRLPDVQLAREAMPGGLIQLQAFALAYPDERGFRVMHAESLCQYAIAFVFDDWEAASLAGRTEDAMALAQRVTSLTGACVEAQLSLLPKEWRADRTAGGAAWDARIKATTKDQVPHLLWIASADAVELALNPLAGLTKLGPISAALAKCIELRPGFHDSDAELLLGTLQANRSQFLGGPDGKPLFAKARTQLGEGSLLVDVMYARSVRSDRATVQATLEKVIATDASKWPDKRLANELAKMKARRYLAAIDKIAPATPAAPPAAE